MSKPKPQKRTFTVEFVKAENQASFDMIAKAIAGAIRKELTVNEQRNDIRKID